MILITGATGKLGGKVIETLLKSMPADQIAAFVRDENKAQHLKEKGISIRLGEYDDKASLSEAMLYVDRVLLISGGNAVNGLEQHQNVVDAAKNAGVKCIAYTGRCIENRHTLVNRMMDRHFETEDYIIASGLNYILFRNILYMESIARFPGVNVLETGMFFPAAGNARASYAMSSDQAEAIGNVLATGDCSSRIYDFTNSESYSFYDFADTLSELSGKKINFTRVDVPTFVQKANELGIPEFIVKVIADFIVDIDNGQENKVSTDMEIALGRKPLTLKEGLKILFKL